MRTNAYPLTHPKCKLDKTYIWRYLRKSTTSSFAPGISLTCPSDVPLQQSRYIASPGISCGWNKLFPRQSDIVFNPGGSVNLNTPQLQINLGRKIERGRENLGILEGEQTIAIASGSITWYPKWVCKSTLLMKQVCVGWVCIHPNVNKECLSWNSKRASSSVVVQESEVAVCGGISRYPMIKALLRWY